MEDTTQWFAAAEEAFAAAVVMSPAPEQLCASLVKAMYGSTMGGECSAAKLARFCHVLGASALHLLVYTEALAAEAKKCKSAASSKQDDGLESELGLAAETELEHDLKVNAMVDDIVGKNLLGVFEPLLVRIVADEHGVYGNAILREAATLALCKFMCISLSTCERHLPLLFTALHTEKHPSVRGNVMVALGDLAFRFPNAVEPWTSQIYRRLRDDAPHVRSQTLMVLTHLILNDMVKVKGQIAEMALSLEDPEPRTADLARMFFAELSKRGNNPVYNLMPDLVSRLSQDEVVSRDAFRRIIPFLMALITKDKHSESLAEKLCHRFATCTTMAQTQDVAFCLAQLPLNDKAVKKLDSLLKCYRNALFDDEVYSCFKSLVSKARKFAKPEFKEAIAEFAAKLEACHNGTGDSDDLNSDVAATEPLTEADENKNEGLSEAADEGLKPRGADEGDKKSSTSAKDKENLTMPRRKGRA
jgi:condensin complex subunit 1